MSRRSLISLALALCLAVGALDGAATLDIYFIDVEGGQATLIATPSGQSLLIDTGFAGNGGRDAARIVAAAKDAGVTRIEYLLITHFHPDHDGGVVELARQIPIGTFIDHGGFDPTTVGQMSAGVMDAYNAYVEVRKRGKHLEPRVGDRLPLKGLDLTFVASAKQTIDRAVSGASTPNTACTPETPPAGDQHENPRSTGFHLRFGEFRFIDLGDLTGPPLYALVCPNNTLGGIDAYLVPHHGGRDVAHPSLVAALRPRVAIVNNGQTKGGSAETFAMLGSAAGLEDVWQLHRSANAGVQNVDEARIANLDETTGHWLKLRASTDGSFSLTTDERAPPGPIRAGRSRQLDSDPFRFPWSSRNPGFAARIAASRPRRRWRACGRCCRRWASRGWPTSPGSTRSGSPW
jgi:beta-lactamase superfamily II metal-dependent hydrolase